MGNRYTRDSMPHDFRALISELMEMVNELADSVTDIKTLYDDHTHNADGSESGAYFTSEPRTDSQGVSAGTASVIAAAPTKISL